MEILELPDDVTPDTYVSFSAPGQFLGAVVAPTADPDEAMAFINGAGLNPGGQAVIFLVPPSTYPHLQLMSKDDLIRIQGEATRLGDLPVDQRTAVEENSLLVCECCNHQRPIGPKTKKGDTTMATRKNEAKSKFPAAPVYDIKIPRGLPKLDGTLTRKERVAVAMDVLALLRLRSKSRKIVLESCYFEAENVPESGQLHSTVLKGECAVCARGILFLASVDRFDRCDLAKFGDCLDRQTVDRTAAEWGADQARLIEGAFENGQMGTWSDSARAFYSRHIGTGDNYDRKPLMRAICRNIVANHGEFIP